VSGIARIRDKSCSHWSRKLGRNLVKNFYHLGVLAAVVDEDEKRLHEVGKDYPDVKLLNSTDDVWDMPVSAVAIATPAPTHLCFGKNCLDG